MAFIKRPVNDGKEQINCQASSQPGAENSSGFPLFRVALVFCLLVLGFHVLEWTYALFRPITIFQEVTAYTVARLVSLIGINCTLNGALITMPHTVWNVVLECTALTAVVVFVSFIVAFPATWRSRAIGIGIGVPFILAVNIFRLVTLAWVTQKIPQSSTLVHDYIWQVAFLFLVVMMWIAWLSLVVNREKHLQVPG
jgi:archaeosortase B (VPXXXP-CTERM-specific)